jgi:tetratricopeptide (TPR) repeat protein
MRTRFILLLLFIQPAQAQNPCQGLSETSCRADYRCVWTLTTGCLKPAWQTNPRPQYQPPTGPTILNIAGWIFLLTVFGFAARFIYRLATEGRKPITPLNNADEHLRAAYNYIKPIWDLSHTDNFAAEAYIVRELAIAAEHLVKARNIDPRSQIHVQEKGKYELYTLDGLSFMALFSEADLYHALAKQGEMGFVNLKDYRNSEGRKALNAIDKSLNYQPTNEMALTLRAKILAALGRRREAHEAATAALRSNPSYMPAQRLRDTL